MGDTGPMQWLDLSLDVFFPEPCVGCGAQPARAIALPLCGPCTEGLWRFPRPVDTEPGQRTAFALGTYEGPLGRALLDAKTRARPRMLRALGNYVAGVAAGRLPRVDAVVPVPSTRRHGLDAAQLIAKPLARALGVPVLPLVARERWSGQKGLSASARRRQAAATYRVPDRGDGAPPLPRRVLLFDDVRTTGATLDACAQELLGAGVFRVHVLTVVSAGANYLSTVEGLLGEEEAKL